jgi:hypothetical protein
MHSSARSELKTGLAESRTETKLQINKCGLLHVCLTEVSVQMRACNRRNADKARMRSSTNSRHAPRMREYPVRRGFAVLSLTSLETGSPAFAGDDGWDCGAC